jgi:hypothetical protein
VSEQTNWWDGMTEALTKMAPYLIDIVDDTTVLRGSMVRVGDEILVSAAPLIRNIVFDAGYVIDPNQLLEVLRLPGMAADGVQELRRESDVRRSAIDPIVPIIYMISHIVTASSLVALRVSGHINVSDEEAGRLQEQFHSVAVSTCTALLAFLEDTRQASFIYKDADDE